MRRYVPQVRQEIPQRWRGRKDIPLPATPLPWPIPRCEKSLLNERRDSSTEKTRVAPAALQRLELSIRCESEEDHPCKKIAILRGEGLETPSRLWTFRDVLIISFRAGVSRPAILAIGDVRVASVRVTKGVTFRDG